jgi:DNA-directed RNA polymerase specialized sigma24 family protein
MDEPTQPLTYQEKLDIGLYVAKRLSRYRQWANLGISQEELLSSAYLGVTIALNTYKDGAYPFKHYCYIIARRQILGLLNERFKKTKKRIPSNLIRSIDSIMVTDDEGTELSGYDAIPDPRAEEEFAKIEARADLKMMLASVEDKDMVAIMLLQSQGYTRNDLLNAGYGEYQIDTKLPKTLKELRERFDIGQDGRITKK